jgi:hypothetical protein
MARMTFVTRVQEYYGAAVTEISQGFALRKNRAKVGKKQMHEERLGSESKPSLSQWYKIKKHVEKHYYKSRYLLPTRGGNFLNWVSGLRPYIEQRTIREEMRSVLEELVYTKEVKLTGNKLSDAESAKVRKGLATRVGVPGKTFDAAKDEIRAVQRELVQQLWKEQVEEERIEAEEREKAGGEMMAGMARAVTGSGKVAPAEGGAEEDDDTFADAQDGMRKMIMELQGGKYGKLTAKQKEEQKKEAKKRGKMHKMVDDDYLVGPLSIDSYVLFRVRPLCQRFEKQAVKLAGRLMFLDVLGFLVNGSGAVLAAYDENAWISLTVAISGVIFSITEFTQLRNQVVSTNLAIKDLNKMLVKWDSLSLVKRRVPSVGAEIVKMTEDAFIMVVIAHCTAAANTQISVQKQLDQEEDNEDDDN